MSCRPDISKEPWQSREEYILARAHSESGNQWAEIAKFLPGRSENSIKNHWNATLRSKAEAKTRTFLWIYGRTVLEQTGITSLETFEKAVKTYKKTPNAEPLENIQVCGLYSVKKHSLSTTVGKQQLKLFWALAGSRGVFQEEDGPSPAQQPHQSENWQVCQEGVQQGCPQEVPLG